MRGLVAGLPTPHPVGGTLPSLYLEDELAQDFCAALDEVLAPVFVTLDCFPAYLDPLTTPLDVLDWLASWVGVVLDEHWPEAQQRELVAAAVALHRWRGTPYGLRELVRLTFGEVPELVESGGSAWSQEPGSKLPGKRTADLVVRLRVADPSTVDIRRLMALVALAAPAHVPYRVEVVAA